MAQKSKHTSDTMVDLGAALMGRLETDQSLYVHGVFEGDLQVTNTVFIDVEGQVSANVTAERVVVQGTVIGNIDAKQVVIHANGKVWGDVCAQALYVESGGFLRGQVIISHESEPKFHPQAPELLEDFQLSAQDPLFAGDLADQPTHTTVEQQTVQQDDIRTEPDDILTTNVQIPANGGAAQREAVQPDTLLAEKETEIIPPQVDSEPSRDEVAPQEQAYTAYCLICRDYRQIKEAHQITLPNGRHVIKGHCAVCGIRFLEQIHLE